MWPAGIAAGHRQVLGACRPRHLARSSATSRLWPWRNGPVGPEGAAGSSPIWRSSNSAPPPAPPPVSPVPCEVDLFIRVTAWLDRLARSTRARRATRWCRADTSGRPRSTKRRSRALGAVQIRELASEPPTSQQQREKVSEPGRKRPSRASPERRASHASEPAESYSSEVPTLRAAGAHTLATYSQSAPSYFDRTCAAIIPLRSYLPKQQLEFDASALPLILK